jgi:hypothetical protein
MADSTGRLPACDSSSGRSHSAAAVYEQVRAFVTATDGQTAKLTPAQKGRFVALCWIGQMNKHFPDPKPAYVADWDQLPQWQQEADADIFERIEQVVRAGN